MDLNSKRRNREITGPTPHAVAIRAKHSSLRPKEHLIFERRKQDQLRVEASAIVNYNKQFDLKSTWEKETAKKLQANAIKRKVDGMLYQQQLSVEERRDKLRDLLSREEEQYMTEIASKQETSLERQAKMRERAKQLKESREHERKALVGDKLEQRWRQQCEEMRGLMSKRTQDAVCTERREQLRLQAERKERERQEDNMYAKLWDEDYRIKCRREEIETTLQIERNREALKVLTLQTASIEQQREDIKKLKEQEAILLREELALRGIEEERALQEKRRQQEQTRTELSLSLRLKLKRQARDKQEELALDMKLLEEMLKQTSNEEQERQDKKNELRAEIKHYKDYLQQQKIEEEKKERELDHLLNVEVEKQWEVRLAQWKKEREARKKLMQDVLEARKQQIHAKLSCIAEEKIKAEQEVKEAEANIQKHKEMEKEHQQRRHGSSLAYQSDLKQQMKFKDELKEAERDHERQQHQLAEEAEYQYQQRIQHAMMNPDLTSAHPRRLLAMRQK